MRNVRITVSMLIGLAVAGTVTIAQLGADSARGPGIGHVAGFASARAQAPSDADLRDMLSTGLHRLLGKLTH